MEQFTAYLLSLTARIDLQSYAEIGFWMLLIMVGPLATIRLSTAFRNRRYRYGYQTDRFPARQAGAPNRDHRATHTTLAFPPPPNLSDPKQQMDAIAHVEFEITPLLNREEARLLPLLESCARQTKKGHRVMAQTSMGEIIRPKHGGISEDQQRAAFASINSKRLDFAIFDRFGRLALAIENQGSGHYQAKSFMRDAVKREVLRKAGIRYLEVRADFKHDELTQQVMAILHPTASQIPATPPFTK